jgi:hypothetical protein
MALHRVRYQAGGHMMAHYDTRLAGSWVLGVIAGVAMQRLGTLLFGYQAPSHRATYIVACFVLYAAACGGAAYLQGGG